MVTPLPRGDRGGKEEISRWASIQEITSQIHTMCMYQKKDLWLSGQTKSPCVQGSHTQSLAVPGMGEVGFLHRMAESHQHESRSSKGAGALPLHQRPTPAATPSDFIRPPVTPGLRAASSHDHSALSGQFQQKTNAPFRISSSHPEDHSGPSAQCPARPSLLRPVLTSAIYRRGRGHRLPTLPPKSPKCTQVLRPRSNPFLISSKQTSQAKPSHPEPQLDPRGSLTRCGITLTEPNRLLHPVHTTF